MLIARYASGGSAQALYLAMYAPHALMALTFGCRLAYNCRAMLRGEPGPWSHVKSFEAISTKISVNMPVEPRVSGENGLSKQDTEELQAGAHAGGDNGI